MNLGVVSEVVLAFLKLKVLVVILILILVVVSLVILAAVVSAVVSLVRLAVFSSHFFFICDFIRGLGNCFGLV